MGNKMKISEDKTVFLFMGLLVQNILTLGIDLALSFRIKTTFICQEENS